MTGTGTDDAVRNRALRAGDWRFLLPDPNPALTICFAGGALVEAARAVFARVVDGRSHQANGDGDVAIAADPDPETLRLAVAALRPAGACYVEFHTALAGPADVRRRLETAGFRDIECYAPRPASARPSMWIPLGSDAAVRYVLSLPSSGGGLRSRVGRALRRLTWFGRWRLQKSRPICAVARAPGSAIRDRASMLEDTLLDSWEGRGVGPPAGRLSTVLMTPGLRPENKVVKLVFAEPCRMPSLVLKMPRVPHSANSLRREAEVLDALTARYGGLAGVPRMLFRRLGDKTPTIGQSFLAGTPVTSRSIRGAGYRRTALRVTDWLADVGRATSEPCDVGWRQRLVEPVLVEFDACFGNFVGRVAIDETADLLKRLEVTHLVGIHDDLTPDNVLITSTGTVNVLDFEFAELRALPGTDLVAFLARLACRRDGAMTPDERQASYRQSGNPRTETSRVWRDCARRYVEGVSLSPTALGPLALLTWMSGACSEFRRLCCELVREPGPEHLRRLRYFRFWREELRLLGEGRSAFGAAGDTTKPSSPRRTNPGSLAGG